MSIEIGKKAPEFTLESSGGKQVKLSDFLGKRVILYFYPKDMTPGCTTQACDFRDATSTFEDLNTVIIGVSADPVKSHDKFVAKYNLPFDLLADVDHVVSEAYGVWKEKNSFGKKYMGIERSTFLIDEAGVLIKEWRKVKVKDHVEEALQYIQSL